jgi:hypothetical protein
MQASHERSVAIAMARRASRPEVKAIVGSDDRRYSKPATLRRGGQTAGSRLKQPRRARGRSDPRPGIWCWRWYCCSRAWLPLGSRLAPEPISRRPRECRIARAVVAAVAGRVPMHECSRTPPGLSQCLAKQEPAVVQAVLPELVRAGGAKLDRQRSLLRRRIVCRSDRQGSQMPQLAHRDLRRTGLPLFTTHHCWSPNSIADQAVGLTPVPVLLTATTRVSRRRAVDNCPAHPLFSLSGHVARWERVTSGGEDLPSTSRICAVDGRRERDAVQGVVVESALEAESHYLAVVSECDLTGVRPRQRASGPVDVRERAPGPVKNEEGWIRRQVFQVIDVKPFEGLNDCQQLVRP